MSNELTINQKVNGSENIRWDLTDLFNGVDDPKINESLAIAAIKILAYFKIKHDAIALGLSNVYWPGRMQLIKSMPSIFFDVAHNVSSFLAMTKFVDKLNIEGDKILILALQKHKDINLAIEAICSTFDKIVFTQTNIRNFIPAEHLCSKFPIPMDNKQIIINPSKAINVHKNHYANDCIVMCGTHYLGGYICEEFKISFDNI